MMLRVKLCTCTVYSFSCHQIKSKSQSRDSYTCQVDSVRAQMRSKFENRWKDELKKNNRLHIAAAAAAVTFTQVNWYTCVSDHHKDSFQHKRPKIANIYRNLPHTLHSQASLLDWIIADCSCHLVSCSCCQCFK